MIRRSTLVLALVAAALGFGLYQLTYKVQDLERELTRLNRAAVAENDAIHVLQAEWSYLNEPGRLAALAKKHLALTAAGDQRIRVMNDLPERAVVPAAQLTGAGKAR